MNQFTTKGVLHVLMWNYKKFNNVQETQKKTQNTDPAFNSYLLLNGFKKNEKKKRSATSTWYIEI